MIRVQVRFTEYQRKWLKETAAEQGVSVSEVVRRAIDQLLADRNKPNINELRRRAILALGCGHSGVSDLARRHDDYLADAYMDWKDE